MHSSVCSLITGWRRSRPDSLNTAWRNASFRGYADHMSSAEFIGGLDELLRMCFACAESR
jgi:hypothetical protein